MRTIVLTLLLVTLASPLPLLGQAHAPSVRAFETTVVQARPLPLGAVRLTGGPLGHAQQLDADYLLKLEPDRMMHYYRVRAGLEPKAEPYGGWDGGGRNLTGHIAGHYLSAASLMYAATGDERYKERVDYLVDELKAVQEAHGDGYLSALEGGREAFQEVSRGEIRSGGFDLNGLWAPWYTLHKMFAGLRDAYRYAGNEQALEMEVRFAEWAEGILEPIADDEVQQMLDTEFGGMNEVLVDLYADTGNDRWLDLSYRFEHEAFIEPLQRHQDNLAGKHGNTQVPKLLGSADRFGYTGNAADIQAAGFFWDRVVQHHTFATGGHGKDEYFRQPGELSTIIDGRTAETCNVYNMLKLTRRLFSFRPDAHYADFHERALYNHILASIDPQDGRTSYMVPVGRGVEHEYADMFESFTCCVGTGMESHALHSYGIYYEHGDTLWINLYAPTEAEWARMDADLTMETDFPTGETARLTLALPEPRELTLKLRRPFWAEEGFAVKVNGETVVATKEMDEDERRGYYASDYVASSYVELSRVWESGDVVEIALPKSLRLEPTPDDPRRVAIMWGPLVLAGDLGPPSEADGERPSWFDRPKVPVFVTADRPVDEWLQPVGEEPGHFRTAGVGRIPDAAGRRREVDFVPFYQLHRRTYGIYWDTFTPEEWTEEKAAYAAQAERQRKLDAATVAYAQPGEMQPERDFNYQAGENSWVRRILERPGRTTRTWFSFDLPVERDTPMTLLVTYYTDDRRTRPASFDIFADDQQLAHEEMRREEPGRFYDVRYRLPADLVEGQDEVTVRFEADEESQVAAVFGLRMIRADAE